MQRFYNGYLCAEDATERIYNPDLVLFYLLHWRDFGKPPRDMLDINVKVDYSKLRLLATPPGGVQDWQLQRMETLLSTGQISGLLTERAQIDAARQEALEQLEGYLADSSILALVKGDRLLRAATLVVVGMKVCHWRLEREV